MAIISNNDIAHAIYLATRDKAKEEQSLVYGRVVKFLNKKRLLPKAPDILLRLSNIINKYEGRIKAKISSGKEIDETTKKEIIETLARRYFVKEVALEYTIDEKLLGGFKVEVGDEIIDLTIKKKIEKLQEHLTNNRV
ncbi:MAG: F0F1 ATP synthase subunit delta [Minisyncoccia bacterium]